MSPAKTTTSRPGETWMSSTRLWVGCWLVCFFFRVDARIKQKAVDLLIYHGWKILKMDINIDIRIYIYDIYIHPMVNPSWTFKKKLTLNKSKQKALDWDQWDLKLCKNSCCWHGCWTAMAWGHWGRPGKPWWLLGFSVFPEPPKTPNWEIAS